MKEIKYPKVGEIITGIIDSCETEDITMSSEGKDTRPILFNQRATIRRINHYINNRYLTLDDDALFWNISNSRITHFSKLISPDTKDFYPYGLGQLNLVQAWILRKKVSAWFDENAFYKTLNDLGEGIATYGSVVWKRYKEMGKTQMKEVNIDNLFFNQSVENICDADGIVEKHYVNRKELLDKKEVWDDDAIDKVFEKEQNNKGDIEIREFTGYYYDKDSEYNKDYIHCVVYGEGSEAILLWEESITEEDNPYEDFHLGRYRGRWMRVGVVERLFKLQERTNQLVNQNAQADEIASLLLMKSDSPDMTGNVLEQAVNGQIIPDATLQQVAIVNQGIASFLNQMNLINAQADRVCLTPEIIQGEASPSNTTFRGIAVVNAGAVTAFKNYRQNIFEKIAHVLMEYIFPEVVKGWNKGDIIEMAEDEADVEEYDKSLQKIMEIENLLGGDLTKIEGRLITAEKKLAITNKIQEQIKGIGRKVEAPKNYFNFKWGFKMMPTDDSVDKSAKNDAYYNALQLISANPALNNVPAFKQYLEDNGISWWKLTPAQVQELQQQTGAVPEQKQPDKLLAQAQPLS